MVITVLKTTFAKTKPKMIRYRSYKHFDNYLFCRDLERNLDVQNTTYKHFEYCFLRVLNRHAPLKKKTLRANDAPYMTSNLRKAIATRSRLQNRFCRNKTYENKSADVKQRNYCSRLYKSERKKIL